MSSNCKRKLNELVYIEVVVFDLGTEAQSKLNELEKAREEMDAELRAARHKNAERNREILETRLKLFSAPIVDDEKITRARRSVSMREGRSVAPLRPKVQLPLMELDPS